MIERASMQAIANTALTPINIVLRS